jgi:hypothetical protein
MKQKKRSGPSDERFQSRFLLCALAERAQTGLLVRFRRGCVAGSTGTTGGDKGGLGDKPKDKAGGASSEVGGAAWERGRGCHFLPWRSKTSQILTACSSVSFFPFLSFFVL